jgi:uncharacterized membrane protein YccC
MPGLGWVRRHDPGLLAVRRAARVAVVMPAVFALAVKVIGNPGMATFAAFGSIAMLLMVDFGGDMRERVTAEVALAITGGVFIVVGTLASRYAWLAAVVMAIVGFAVIFAGVVSSVLAAATTPLLLAFILPASLPGPVSSIPDRLAGWGLAGGAAVIAIVCLWPAPKRSPLRAATSPACRAIAARLRADVAYVQSAPDATSDEEHDQVAARSAQAIADLRRLFLATPNRPTGLSTDARALVRLVDELTWLQETVVLVKLHPRGPLDRPATAARTAACAVKSAAADLLDESAILLEHPEGPLEPLVQSLAQLRAAVAGAESEAIVGLPRPAKDSPAELARIVSSLDPGFRAQELGFAVTQIATNVRVAVAADRRSWIDRLLGRQPEGQTGPLAAARERAAGHIDRHSVWLHNSIRGAIGLGVAVLVANLSGVEHAFWVVLGTLSVLRSSALNTGHNAVRAIAGTVIGVVIGAAILAAIGSDSTLLWCILPLAVLLAGFLPTAISFAAGQGGFTLVLVILFNILAPVGWHIGVLRIEDISVGCLVSIGVGVLLWPRGAAAALGQALAEAYDDMAGYLAAAIGVAASCRNGDDDADLAAATVRGAASARRLDDAFRSYLAERGTKPVPLAEMVALVNGVIGIRLAADAVIALWSGVEGPGAVPTAAGAELTAEASEVTGWYRQLAQSLAGDADVPPPAPASEDASERLVAAVHRDRQIDGQDPAVAVRMIWTGDHLDAAHRLQSALDQPARAATAPSPLPLGTAFPRRALRRALSQA